MLCLFCIFQDPFFNINGIPLWYIFTILYTLGSLWRNFTFYTQNLNAQLALFTAIFILLHAFLSGSSIEAVEFGLRCVVMFYILPIILWHDIQSMTNEYRQFTRKSLNYVFLGNCICGFLQSISFFTGMGEPLINYSLRPTAFTAESTWFGLIGLIGIINISKEKSYFRDASIIIFLASIIISESRNAYIGLILYTVLFDRKLLLYMLLIGFLMSLYVFDMMNMSSVFDKFKLTDLSSIGRFAAYTDSFNLISANIFGTGWGYSYSNGVQPTIGSKSFNLLFHFLHVYGWFGIIPIISLLYIYFMNKKYILSLIKVKSFIILLVLCMFSPVHFSPFYIIILAVLTLNLTGARKSES